MVPAIVRVGALLLAGAGAQDCIDETMLIQSSAMGTQLSVVESFGSLVEDAPEWCKNETSLTWAQRKERMQQHATLEWAKQQVKELRAANQTIPAWMDKIVTDDASRGRMRWAVQESKHLKAEGKEVPQWMTELVQEDAKWANRWAACKAVELKNGGREVPDWMAENGRKGIMEYAEEKMNQLQEQIDELEEERQKEQALVRAKGDPALAAQRMLAQTSAVQVRSSGQQMRALEAALAELDEAVDAYNQGDASPRLKKAMADAKEASDVMNRIVGRKVAMVEARFF